MKPKLDNTEPTALREALSSRRSVVVKIDGQAFRCDAIVYGPREVTVMERDWVMEFVSRFLAEANPASRFEIEVQ